MSTLFPPVLKPHTPPKNPVGLSLLAFSLLYGYTQTKAGFQPPSKPPSPLAHLLAADTFARHAQDRKQR